MSLASMQAKVKDYLHCVGLCNEISSGALLSMLLDVDVSPFR